ncbi:MAG: Hsp20 family protein [Cyclobacteriaceae bacterium]|nr:Hsp20 family protein [Cyclobacteriaceae bacterium]
MYIGEKLHVHTKSFHHRIREGNTHYVDRDQFLGIDPFDKSLFHDIYDSKQEEQAPKLIFKIELSLPGYQEKEISIGFEGKLMVIKGKRDVTTEWPASNTSQQERVFMEFERHFLIEDYMPEHKMEQNYRNGLLVVCLYASHKQPLSY